MRPQDDEIGTSPLHARTAARNRSNRWVTWNDVTVPDTLAGYGEEARALAETVLMTDASPLVRIRVTGPEAAAALSRMCTYDMESVPPGAAAPALWCGDDGLVRGFGRIMRLTEETCLLLTEVNDRPWFEDALEGFAASLSDETGATGAIAVSGPLAPAALAALGAADLGALGPRSGRAGEIRTMPVTALRPGADRHLILVTAAEDAPVLWDWLLETAAETGLVAGGFAAAELRRLLAGEPAPGRDVVCAQTAADPADAVSPSALGPDWAVPADRGWFSGRVAIDRAGPPRRRLVPVRIAEQAGAAYAPVLLAGRPVGATVTCAYAPRQRASIGLAWIESRALAAPGPLTVQLRLTEGLRPLDRTAPLAIRQ